MTKFSVFVSGVCCAHAWRAEVYGEACPKCGAYCQRDKGGSIVLYSRPAPVLYTPPARAKFQPQEQA